MTASDNTSQQKKPDTASQISSDMTKETSKRKIDDAHEPEQTTEQEYATENSEEESLSETKIVMTSPEPDVVIATLDAPDDDSDQSELSSPNADTAAHASETASEAFLQTQEDSDTSEAPNNHVSQPVEPISIDHSIHENDPAVADVDDHLTTESATTNTSGENVESDDDEQQSEEKIKDEREAKLESYKQFVAEQFSDQKIDYPEVRVTIEANALPSKMYFVMNTLSAIIASYGLVTNSAAVVIGAMLVAMMLGPITGVALAIIDYRMPLLRKSLLTVLAGVFLVILVGFVVGLLHQGQPLTNEILSRTQPTSMDLMIALAGGTAGAYAMVSPHLSVAVVGVAVATALVPPLAASGILFANGEIQMGLGAALLALTNIIAIQFTNAMVLWFLGFRRLVDDDYESGTYLIFFRRNAVTLLLLVGLGIYLTLNLNSNAKQQTFENNVKEAINEHFIDQGNVLTNIQFDKNNAFQIIRAVVRGETSPNSQDVQQIEDVITKDMAENFPKYLPIKLQLRYLPVQVIESDPLIKDKLDETDAVILTNSP
ncbi:uncharacterized hydrophobic domain-containing protein [Psychrobacter pacificensis]|uniref:Uncharacterized hydrophobic domain-containing protein n=1 Tax=Psychrobacter pacificensis TaxID=112002 RepID=A0A1G6VYH9_9GAMM|nr:DUF389 domain-containing protein [Psychrobacter pacificensis]GLR28847.1 hypothetical protein GCM10007915_10850 [Psychrobacter pacificensis]SDD58629.1 uncharacterized hydrophobic domain-containing protein [Psychrobacter pacificensis]